MNKADWIVLRLVVVMVQGNARLTLNPDVQRSVLYLINKYGMEKVYECIDAIKAEKGEE